MVLDSVSPSYFAMQYFAEAPNLLTPIGIVCLLNALQAIISQDRMNNTCE